FGTSVPILIPPPIFSYLFLSSKSFIVILLAEIFNLFSSLSEPITAPLFVRLSVSTFPPFLAINVVCLSTHSFSPFPLPLVPAFDSDKFAICPLLKSTFKLIPVCEDELDDIKFSSLAFSLFYLNYKSFNN
ncbi:MAG: hypothetical protein Q4A58_07890, partial [Fusobacterium sp.]|uniref:hypothetical protein n=1 Tax=Fusobacterium sp. TaxID=68766 RepID=UPI0026DCC25D